MIPDQGLSRDTNGVLIDNTGFAEAPIEIRNHDSGGVIATVNYPSTTTSFNISRVSRFSLWVQFTLGNLTNLTISIGFPITESGGAFFKPMPLFTAGSRVIGFTSFGNPLYTIALSCNFILPLINPGAEWLRFNVLETHVTDTDNSKLGLHYSRSYLNHDIGDGIPA